MRAMRSIRRVKLILPALTEATSHFWRPIKYSLFPPLGLAALAAHLDPDLEISLQDEHVEKLDLNDQPDLVIKAPSGEPMEPTRLTLDPPGTSAPS
jgi:hypothetical protein